MIKYIYPILLLVLFATGCKKESKQDVVFEDPLTTVTQPWLVDSTSIDYRQFRNGHYEIGVDTMDIIAYSIVPYSTLNFPYTLQVNVVTQLNDSTKIGGTGVIFNYSGDTSYYVLQVNTNGTFLIWTSSSGTRYNVLGATYNSAIHTSVGSTNELQIVQSSSSMQLTINNMLVGTFYLALDTSYSRVGIAACTYGGSDYTPVTCLFNNFEIIKN